MVTSSGWRPLARICLGTQVASCDVQLLFFGVAGQLQHLHAVAQRRRDGIERVGGGDEEDLREVERPGRGSCRGTNGSAPGRALPAAPMKDRHASRTQSLSTSSSMNTGSFVPARRIDWRMRPGIAPMYVRRWPRISASSCMPPSDMRTNSRPSARAIEWPSEVLPTPGGPTKHRIGSRLVGARRARATSFGALAVLLQAAHRQIFEDAVLDLFQVVVVFVQHLAGIGNVNRLARALVPWQGD